MNYFTFVKDLADLKSQYKALCRVHHPDLGGSTEAMQKLNAEYDYVLSTGNFDFEETKSSMAHEMALRDIIERLVVIKGLVVELTGSWLWIGGETQANKEILKSLGCRWARKKHLWYFRDEANARNGKGKSSSMSNIRAKYGSKVYASKRGMSLA